MLSFRINHLIAFIEIFLTRNALKCFRHMFLDGGLRRSGPSRQPFLLRPVFGGDRYAPPDLSFVLAPSSQRGLPGCQLHSPEPYNLCYVRSILSF